MIAVELGRQFVFIGLVDGLAYALLALGVILIYRSDRVINFAIGAVGVLAAQIMARMVIEWDVPYWPALVVSVAAGAAFLGVSQLIVGRRLARAPRVILLVATIGLAQLATVLTLALPDPDARGADFPSPWAEEFEIFGVRVTGAELVLFVVSAALVAGIGLWMSRSMWGQAIRASAADPDRARLVGIDPGMMSTVVWTLTGAFAATVAILQEADGSAFRISTPGPALMVRVLTVAVVARFVSFPRAVVAGLLLGVAEALIRVNWTDDLGRFEAILLVVVIIAVWRMPRADGDDHSFSFAPRVRPIPASLRDVWWVRNHAALLGTIGVIVAAVVPLLVDRSSRLFLYSRILVLALAALSLVVLTGWAGQISLGQGAFAGIGALTAAALANGQDLGLGVGDAYVDVPVPDLSFPVAVVVAVAVTAAIAMIIGLGALRIEGLLLAVVTLVFAVSADRFFYRRPFLSGGDPQSSSVFLERETIGPFDLSSQRTYYYVALLGLVLTMAFVAHLRRTGIGRMIIAVRENPDAAAAATISPVRAKLLAFGVAGGVAGFAGALLGGLLAIVLFEELSVATSFELLSIAVIGGVGSVAGPVLGSLWVVGLPAFWPENELVPLLTSSLGLLVLLMYAPGGFVQLWYTARDAGLRALERSRPAPEPPARRPAPVRAATDRPAPTEHPLTATDVTVRFGQRVAVDDVDLRVEAGEIVGLIGTNGAGKTTLMNAIGGFVPADGQVKVLGRDVSNMRPAARHRLGMGRTFQAAHLFGDLTVRETILVGLEARQPTRFVPTALGTPGARRSERTRRSAADELIDFLGLGLYADNFVGELSTGTRRIVELAGLLANDAQLLCLDEPAGGVAQRETEALGPLLVAIRDELDASILVIEHDMPFLMGISHRVVALAAGQVIAEGSPDEVRGDQAVIESYLGTDERAVARSGAASTGNEER